MAANNDASKRAILRIEQLRGGGGESLGCGKQGKPIAAVEADSNTGSAAASLPEAVRSQQKQRGSDYEHELCSSHLQSQHNNLVRQEKDQSFNHYKRHNISKGDFGGAGGDCDKSIFASSSSSLLLPTIANNNDDDDADDWFSWWMDSAGGRGGAGASTNDELQLYNNNNATSCNDPLAGADFEISPVYGAAERRDSSTYETKRHARSNGSPFNLLPMLPPASPDLPISTTTTTTAPLTNQFKDAVASLDIEEKINTLHNGNKITSNFI